MKKRKRSSTPRIATSFVFLLALVGGIGIYSLSTSPIVTNVLGDSTKLAQNIYPWYFYFNKPSPTPMPVKPFVTTVPSTILSIPPVTKDLFIGQEYDVNVYLNTNGNQVSNVEFEGVLDPLKFQLVYIKNASPFVNIVENIYTPGTGKFRYAMSTSSVSQQFNGSTVSATLRFKVKTTAPISSGGILVTQLAGKAYGAPTGSNNLMKPLTDGSSQVFIRPTLPTPQVTRVTSPTPEANSTCRRTGCSGQICSDREINTTCEYKQEFACYQNAKCERQTDGNCSFTQTNDLRYCLSKYVTPTPLPRISSTPRSVPVTSTTPTPISNILPNPRFDTCQIYPWNKINGTATNKYKQDTQMSIYKDSVGNCKLKVSCGAASCLDNQSVYQDLSAVKLRGKTLQYSGLFSSIKGSANLTQTIYALDGNGKVLGQATIPMTIGQADSKGNSVASIPVSAQSKFVVPSTAETIRYQINFKTIPEAVYIDNLTLYTR